MPAQRLVSRHQGGQSIVVSEWRWSTVSIPCHVVLFPVRADLTIAVCHPVQFVRGVHLMLQDVWVVRQICLGVNHDESVDL